MQIIDRHTQSLLKALTAKGLQPDWQCNMLQSDSNHSRMVAVAHFLRHEDESVRLLAARCAESLLCEMAQTLDLFAKRLD